MGFMKNRLTVTVDYYNKRTKNLLLQTPIAGYDGGGTFLKNIGVVGNKGLEVSIDFIPVETGSFTWTSTFNAATYANKVLSLGKDSILYRPIVGEGLINTNLQVVKTGEAFGSFYLIPWRGVYRSDDPALGFKAGDNSYQDTNGDGQIGFDDRVIVGNAMPKFLWGWNNNFKFKNIEVNFFIQSSLGNKVFNATYAGIAAPTSDVYYPTLAESSHYWSVQNPGASWADPASKTGRSYVESTRYLQDGSYVRLKNISLAYVFPNRLVHLPELKVYVSAQNLVTITKYKGYDPEAGSTSDSDIDGGIDLGAYPSPRIITVGVHVVL
jgi:hypothetical protein